MYARLRRSTWNAIRPCNWYLKVDRKLLPFSLNKKWAQAIKVPLGIYDDVDDVGDRSSIENETLFASSVLAGWNLNLNLIQYHISIGKFYKVKLLASIILRAHSNTHIHTNALVHSQNKILPRYITNISHARLFSFSFYFQIHLKNIHSVEPRNCLSDEFHVS